MEVVSRDVQGQWFRSVEIFESWGLSLWFFVFFSEPGYKLEISPQKTHPTPTKQELADSTPHLHFK